MSCCCGRERISSRQAADVLLLVEVADTSLAFDRGLKLALYARHRIPEIWIVNIPGATLEIFALQRSKATPPTRI